MTVACTNPLFYYAIKPSQAGTWDAIKKISRLIVAPRTIEKTVSVASTPKCDTRAYAEIQDLIQSFGDPVSELFVDEDAREQANDFIWKLISFDAPPPTVFSSGGDAVVFVWKKFSAKNYIYYSDDTATVVNIPFEGREQEINFNLSDSESARQLAMYIGQ